MEKGRGRKEEEKRPVHLTKAACLRGITLQVCVERISGITHWHGVSTDKEDGVEQRDGAVPWWSADCWSTESSARAERASFEAPQNRVQRTCGARERTIPARHEPRSVHACAWLQQNTQAVPLALPH